MDSIVQLNWQVQELKLTVEGFLDRVGEDILKIEQ